MYLKLAGCLVVILAASGYGYCQGLEYKSHVEEIEYLCRLVGQIQGEISYTKAPLSVVLSRVGKRVREPYRKWLLELSEAMEHREGVILAELWKKKAEESLKDLHLSLEEHEELQKLGEQMGYLDIRMQEEALAWYRKQLEARGEMLSGALAEKRRLCSCLGVMSGIFLAIVLI